MDSPHGGREIHHSWTAFLALWHPHEYDQLVPIVVVTGYSKNVATSLWTTGIDKFPRFDHALDVQMGHNAYRTIRGMRRELLFSPLDETCYFVADGGPHAEFRSP